MSGETRNAYAVQKSDTDSKEQGKGTLLDQFGDKPNQESVQQYKDGSLVPLSNSGSKFVAKVKEHSQREAVIRPQQTGKIDFKSLQNRSKFSSDDRPWSSNKGSPQSPSGKKSREKGKKACKSERGTPQQLYRLSITNARSNPTIGIAYPQQKVTPPKKLEESVRGPVSGSYRFHVPSVPEREAELQQHELSYSRGFQEATSSFTSTNYTSQAPSTAGSVPVSHHAATTHQLGVFQGSSAQPGGQLHPAEFQVNGTSAWQPPEKTFNGANYGGSSHKPSILIEGSKTNASFMPLPFQYEYPSVQESAADPFPCDHSAHSVHYIDIPLPNSQMGHSPFIHSSGGGQEDSPTNNQFDLEQPEGRLSYVPPPAPPQHAHYLQNQHGQQGSLHCYKGRNEHSCDNEVLISSSKHMEQNSSNLADSTTAFRDGTDVALVSVSKSLCPSNDTSQRLLVEGNSHLAQDVAQAPESQLHLTSKACSSLINTIHMGPVSFEKRLPCGANKNTSRLSETWEGDKIFPPLDQNSEPLHSSPCEKSQFQCQSAGEQKQHRTKNRNMPWQNMHITSAVANQNRIELSRQLSSQKLTFLTTTSDWQESNDPNRNHPLNNPDGYRNKMASESFIEQQESIKQNCTSVSVFPFESSMEVSGSQVCDSRNKTPYFEQKQSLSRAIPRTSHAPLQAPPLGLSPSSSPLASPMQNVATGSTCSSSSPTSTSPVLNTEDSQFATSVPPPPFYHQHQGKMLTPSDHLNSDLQHFHSNISRAFLNPPEKAKEDAVSNLHNIKYKPTIDSGKSFMHGIVGEQHPPPLYSAHQLFASSLDIANLEKLDVLLTCKQCDQNFQNLPSFLEHKQYCGHHTLTQKNELKQESKMEELRKCQVDTVKNTQSGTAFSLAKYPSDMHLSLLGLNKNGELISDNDIKGEPKDDPSKLNLFAGNSSLPDLEMDDAKLDSLITETLNGLGYQSDNAEIDSSFIDAFADDELTTAKVTGSMQPMKNKDCAMFESRSKHVDSVDEKPQTQGTCISAYDTEILAKNRQRGCVLDNTVQDNEQGKKDNIREVVSHFKDFSSEESEGKLDTRKEGRSSGDDDKEEKKGSLLLSSRYIKQSKIKSFQGSYSSMGPVVPHTSSNTQYAPSQKTGVKYSKRRKAGGGTWSKELIHKIVQQKNKLHKLHTKGTKNQQYSLMMEKVTPVTQNPKFEEYDYVSDSDEDYGPLKIVHKGRLGHSRHYKYTYSKEYKGGEQSNKANPVPWNCESKESLEVNVAEDILPSTAKQISTCRMRRRRSSRSSTSSEHSTPTSLSCDSIYSPKNTDRTDSDSEKGLAMKKITSSNVLLMDYFVHDVYETSTVETCKEPSKTSSQLFSRNTKRYGSAKFLLSANINSCRIGMESTSELSNASSVSKSLMRYNSREVSSQEKEQHCRSHLIGKEQSVEDSANLRRKDRKLKELNKVHENSYSTGPHSELLPTDITYEMPPKSCSVDIKDEIVEKEEAEYEVTCGGVLSNSCKDLLPRAEMPVIPTKNEMNNFGCHMDPKGSILCSPPVDDMHRCPSDMQDPVEHKDITVPDLTEPDQGLVKSPLPFDTSSLFGDLTVTGFDSSLYGDISDSTFGTFGSRNDKKSLFDPTFSPFLKQKEWGLMTDVTPIIRDESHHFKDHSDKETLKKTDTCHTDLSLPDKILDYNTNPSNNVSEDELEIKKIVTELESKLKKAQQNNSVLNANELSKQLVLGKTTSFHMDHVSKNEKSSTKDSKSVESVRMTVPSKEDGLNFEDSYSETEQSWSGSFNFGLLEGQHCIETQVHSQATLCVKKHPESTSADDKGDIQCPLKTITKNTDESEEVVAREIYNENLINCLEVISDAVLTKECLTADLEEPNISRLLNRDQQCNNAKLRNEEHSQIQMTQAEDFENQKSSKTEVLFSFENSGNPSLVTKQKEPVAGNTEFQGGSKECTDIIVKDKLTDTKESQLKKDTYDVSDSETSNVKITEEKIGSCGTMKSVASESSQVDKKCGGILRDKDSLSQHQNFLCSAIKDNEERPVTDMSSSILFTSCSVPIPNSSEEADVRKSQKDANCTKKIPETPSNLDATPISLPYERLTGPSVINDLVACHLLNSEFKDKVKNTTVQEEDPKIATSSLETAVPRVTGCQSALTDVKHLDNKLLLSYTEHNGTLLKSVLDASAFENDSKSKAIPDDVSKQVLSDLMTSPLQTTCTNETIKDNETCMSHGKASSPSLCPPESLVPSVGETEDLDKCHSQRLWNNFEGMSPLSKNFEMNANEMEVCNSPVLPISGMSDLLDGLPHVDLGTGENKNVEEGREVSIQSSGSIMSTYKHSDCLLINKDTELTGKQPLYDLKQSSLDFKEMPDISEKGGASSNGFSEYMKSHSTLTKESQDNRNQWQLSLNMPLTYSSPVSPVQEDKDSVDLPTAEDGAEGLISRNPSLQTSEAQSNLKCTCLKPPCPQCETHGTSSIASVVLEFTSTVPQNVDFSKSPLETIDFTDLHGTLLKKTETDKMDLDMKPVDSGALTLRDVGSDDGQRSVQPHLVCTDNVSVLLSRETEPPTIKRCMTNMNNTHHKHSGKKTTASKKHSKQGTILCEFCSACFRTVPGLKRHKGIKHSTKNDENKDNIGQQNTDIIEKIALNNPENMMFYREQSETNHADNTVNLDSDSSSNRQHLETCHILSSEENASMCIFSMGKMNFGEMENQRTSIQPAESKDKLTVPTAMTTLSTASDIPKDKKMDNQNFGPQPVNPDQFSDELLNILKTDILQAITSKYPTVGSQSEDHEIQNLTCLENPALYKENSPVTPKEMLSEEERSPRHGKTSEGDIQNNEMHRMNEALEDNVPDIKKIYEQKAIYCDKGIGTEVIGKGPMEIKCEISTCLKDDVNSHSFCFKDSTVRPQPNLGLEALLDDESTFSQLFPRDEAMIRKKCARVYSKKNKKSSVSNISMESDKQHSDSCSNQTSLQLRDDCKYQTISMDHAIMLDMCHKSTLKNDFEKIISKDDNSADHNRYAAENSEGLDIGNFSSPANTTNCTTAVDWRDSKTLGDIIVGPLLSTDAQKQNNSENSGSSCPPQFTDPPVSLSSDLQESSLFLNIDIQNLNNKFQLPEMPLFDSSKNLPLLMPINDDAEISDNTRSNKKLTERRGRKQTEGVLKLRDKQYKCKVCFTWFLTLGELNFHKLTHNPSPPPTCYMCVQRKFSSREQLRDHLKEKHAKNKAGIWTCGMCLKEISDVWMYNEHLREHATQFARKGQTQNSILGLQGCFMQEAAVKSFITSIMQHRPNKSSKGEKAKMSSKEAGKTVKENVEEKMQTKEGDETAEMNRKGSSDSSRRQTVSSPLRAINKAEASQKTVEMHPNCKDPSRDCHHCGKQFPKPFKLQRHLVVHSLQKIFLCHKCPIFYQDVKELKDHLRNEHKELEEQDSKHTTLYTCELCADVMHVIKKSFICSTCNYTFSKKEQFDRHMEKHLTEGNHIFKFRGVVRPSKPLSSYSKDEDFDLPPSKKRKAATDSLLETSPDSSVESISSSQFPQRGDEQIEKSTLILTTDVATGDTSSAHHDTSIKTEDTADDFSQILSTLEGSQVFVVAASSSLSPSLSKTEFYPSANMETCKVGSESVESLLDNCNRSTNTITYGQCEKQAAILTVGNSHRHVTEASAGLRTTPHVVGSSSTAKEPLPENTNLICKVDLFEDFVSTGNPPSNEDSIFATDTESTEATASGRNSPKDIVTASTTMDKMSSIECTKELLVDIFTNLTSESETSLREPEPSHCFTDAKNKSTDCRGDQKGMGTVKEPSGGKPKNENEQKEPKACKSTGQQDDGLLKDKGSSKPNESTKRESHSSLKSVTESVTNNSKQKKRKDLKIFQISKVCSSATRENLDVELRNVKKIRLQNPSKGEGVGSYKKADVTSDYPVLSSVRDDIASNKMVPKHKAGTLNLQPKKNAFTNYPLKKAENMRQINGDQKGKRGIPIRPLPSSRTSISPVNSSLNKCKPHSSLRSMESHSYRTAESQNHLLSQLFGQKLPSFKIPLRKDASESLS